MDTPIAPPADTTGTPAGIERAIPSLADRAWLAMKREPVLFVTYGYVALSFLGLWASWWFYRGFGVDILEYLQGSDLLVAGMREPMYAFLLVVAIAYTRLLTWPERWRRRHPERHARLRGRWWAPLVFPRRNGFWSWWGMGPNTAMAAGIAGMMLAGTATDSHMRARRVHEGRPGRVDFVQVTLAGAARAEPGTARLLGTSSAFVFVYWPRGRRVEALPLDGIARLRTVPPPVRAAREAGAPR